MNYTPVERFVRKDPQLISENKTLWRIGRSYLSICYDDRLQEFRICGCSHGVLL